MISKKLHHAVLNRLQTIMGNIELAMPTNSGFVFSEKTEGEYRARLQKAKSEIMELTRLLANNVSKR
jgi:hypothetical protein